MVQVCDRVCHCVELGYRSARALVDDGAIIKNGDVVVIAAAALTAAADDNYGADGAFSSQVDLPCRQSSSLTIFLRSGIN